LPAVFVGVGCICKESHCVGAGAEERQIYVERASVVVGHCGEVEVGIFLPGHDDVFSDFGVEDDGFIPGCPPPLKLLGNSLINLLENKEIVLPQNNMCSSCPLRGEEEIIFEKQIKNLIPTIEEDVKKEEKNWKERE